MEKNMWGGQGSPGTVEPWSSSSSSSSKFRNYDHYVHYEADKLDYKYSTVINLFCQCVI
jgi:hypothetical protein